MVIFSYIAIFVIIKILIQERKLSLKDICYISLTTIFVGFVENEISQISYVLSNIMVIFFISLYLHKAKSYTIRKAVILALVAAIIANIIDFLISFMFYYILPEANGDILLCPVTMLLHFLLLITSSAVISVFVVELSKDMREIINQNRSIQNALLCIIPFFVISFRVRAYLGFQLDVYMYEAAVNAVFFAANMLMALIFLALSARSVKARTELQKKEVEQKELQLYTDELERQQTAMRKFKHDYQNILVSIKTFIADGDLAGLSEYYTNEIETASESITRDNFAFEALSKIKVKELKSIIAAKMMLVQNAGKNITARFEANEEIDDLPINSIALIRMLGIILDNAVEELTELGSGVLLIGCFKTESSYTFIVQNTCRDNMPKFHQLWQKGFSTKGIDRGLGLINLIELVNSHPNVTLETDIEENMFIQRLMITAKQQKGV